MARSVRPRLLLSVLVLLICLVLTGITILPRALAVVTPDPVLAAWEKARAAGSYHFDSDIIQVTIPVPKVTNIGHSSRTDALRLEGQTDLRHHSLEMRLWSEGGSLAQDTSGVTIKVEDGKSSVRQNSGQWQEMAGGFDAFAPQGDFLSYLAAVREVQAHAPEKRAGIAFTRYSFTIDGPTFAQFMRSRVQEALQARGELPPGVNLETSPYYRDMHGDGELWVREDGLPLRQILNLTFPPQKDEYVSAQIVVDFSRFGQPQSNLVELAYTRDLSLLLAALPQALPDLTLVWLLTGLLVVVTILLYYRRRRTVQAALAAAVIASMLLNPLLHALQIDAFFAAQSARAAVQEEQRAESNMQRSLRSLGDRPEFNPHANPLEGVQNDLSPLQFATFTASPSFALQSVASGVTSSVDNGVDSDGDGLSDFVEARVGTNPNVADSDEDGISDYREVMGFTYAGKTWYTDPWKMDSNDDGIADAAEWGRNADGTLLAIPQDTDGDGIPDLFDPDNDGDGVPDRMDISPFTKGNSTVTEANPFNLTIRNLTAGKPTFVDFQLRPTDPKHLWFAFNVLDWPRGDNQGQVQDIDGGTYAQLAAAEGRAAAANESYGDMKLIPMLEIRMPAAGANLPPQSDLTPYNIIVNNLTEDGSQKVAYVPLSLMTDEKTGERVAFTGRMRYLPTGDWPSAHQVRLAWVVQVLTDLACDYDNQEERDAGCQQDGYFHNVPQVVQSYYDSWTLTGFNVSEEHGATTVIIYEDPDADADLQDDAALVALTHAFDQTLLGARDADEDNQRDVDINHIATHLDSLQAAWDLTNIFGTHTSTYATFDQAVMFTAMTDTLSVLDNFNLHWSANQPIMPTLLYAYETDSRALSLDALLEGQIHVNLDLNNLYVDFQPAQQPVEKVTVAGLKWVHYCRDGQNAAWEICPAEVYWEELERRHGSGSLPGDPIDPDVQTGRMFLTQLYDMALTQGVNNAVQQGNTLIAAQYSLKDDPAIASYVRAASTLTRQAVVFLVNQAVLANASNISLVTQLGQWANGILNRTQGNVQAFKQAVSGGEFSGGAIILVIKVVVVVGVIVAMIFAAQSGGQDQRIALRALSLGLQIFLSLIDPVLTYIRVSSAAASGVTLASKATAINVSQKATAVGTVIAIAVVWGFFIYSMVANKVSAFSPEFNRALAETIATTIYLIILALLAATVIGLILVGIVAVIDAILTAICELGVDDLRKVPGLGGACFTLGTVAIKAIAYALYNYDVMINTSRRDMVSPGAPETTLADPTRGYVAGNELSITMPIQTNISHKSPDAANGLMINLYLYFFSTSNLRSTTFKYSLTEPDKEDLSASRNQMSGAWQNVREHHKYAATPMYGGHAATKPTPVKFNFGAGVNRTAAFFLNTAYALPAYECWIIPTPFYPAVPVCYTRTFSGKNSTRIETLHYDIFPATFSQFIALATKPDGGRGLAWDSRFPSLVDADGDGLFSSLYGGLDPDDSKWDTDNDGLSDANELERRAAGMPFSPIQCDTDGDGLTDAQEVYFGTNPSIRDTDNDGLSDAEEVWHQVYDTTTCEPTGVWAGGWDVTINAATPFTIRVTSDPLRADTDGDGISDLAEKQLAQHPDPTKRLDDQNRPYHPGVFNSSPIKIYPATDRQYVRPGGSVTYSNTVVSKVELVPSVLDVTLPSAFGPSPAPATLNFNPLTFSGSQTVTHQSVLTALPGIGTQTVAINSSVRACLMDTGPATLGWEPLISQPLGSTAYPARFSAAAAPWLDRQDSYLMSAMLSSSTSRGGNGVIQTNAVPSGQASTLVTDGGASTRRGASSADIACNAAGNCMVVWEETDLCNTLTINYLKVVASGESGGIEPVIYWIPDYNDNNSGDGGYELVWNPFATGNNGSNLGANAQRGPNANGFPITINVCGDGRIDIYEADTTDAAALANPTNSSRMDLIGSSLRIGPDNRNLEGGLLSRFTRSGITSTVDLHMSMPRKNLNTIRGAVVGPTGNVVRSSFEIPSALPISTNKSHNFRPVVASDGVNFMVMSELADETSYRTHIDVRRFDGNGNALGTAATHLIENSRVAAPTENSVALDLIWIGDRYRAARKFIRSVNTAQTIAIRDWDTSGTALGAGWTTATTQAVPTASGPTLAYNPRADQTLLLFLNTGSAVRRILYTGSSLTPVLGEDFLDGGSPGIYSYTAPLASYNPMADGWLISWTRTSAVAHIVSLWRPDLSGRRLPDQLMFFWEHLNSSSLACPAAVSQAVADLRFEELPVATLFADSSGRGNNATCNGAACPTAGWPGAVDNLGNAAGTPASDFALRFDGNDDRITLPNPIGGTFTIAFWYKAGATNVWEPFRIYGGSEGFDVRIYNTTQNVEIASGNTVLTAPTGSTNLRNGQWHFVAVTRNASGGLALYLNGNETPVGSLASSAAPAYYSTIDIFGGGTTVYLDHLQFYRTALSGASLKALYERTRQSYCVNARYHDNQYLWTKLHVSQPDVRGGKLAASGGMNITIDGDLPTSSIGGWSNNQYILGNRIHTIGGNANDATSGAAGVEVSVNNGAFQPANGAATWAYNLSVGEGRYTIRSRATDVAGNVENPGSGIAVIADATPPNVALNAPPATASIPTRNAGGKWIVTLSGAATDPTSGGQTGSGVHPGSVEVLLRAQAGEDDAQGNGWQQATLSGNTWSITYLFADGLLDPTGVYSVFVRAADNVGNRTADNVVKGTLKLDGAAPVATLANAEAIGNVISDTVTIGGEVADIGPAGLQQVEVAFVSLEQIAALPVDVTNDEAQDLLDAAGRTWHLATLAQTGVTSTTWSIQIPAGLEGEYQIDLRGSDMLNNRGVSSNVWRGVIDTLAPRLVITATHTNAVYFDSIAGIPRYEFIYTCSAEDRYLVEQDFACDGNAFQPAQRFFHEDASMQALFPDRTILSKLANGYSQWEGTLQPLATVGACDAFGHCDTLSNQQLAVLTARAATQEPSVPKAVVVAPGNLRYVASTGTLNATIAAEAGAGLKEVTLALDGVDVNTLTFDPSEIVTRTQRTVAIAMAGIGARTLVARATDLNNILQSELYPVTFTLDAEPPLITLDTSDLTTADTWQLGSGILRFNGTASDDVGLAAVQVKVDDQPFANATFGNGAWRTALLVNDPEGRPVAVTARAIDFAGQVTLVSHNFATHLSAVDAPDTVITGGPSNPSDDNTAIFTFEGIPGGREATAFECVLDKGNFTPCTSPWNYSDLSKGSHTFAVRAIDSEGYVDLSPASFTWTVNASALDAMITGAPANPNSSRDATFSFTGNGSGFECALNGADFAPCTSPHHYSGLAYGLHIFQVRALDNAGNRGAADRFLWTVANAAPVANSQALQTLMETAIAVTLTASDSDLLTYKVGAPAHGALHGIPPALTYVPNSGFTGIDSFTFIANDGQVDSSPATISIRVQEEHPLAVTLLDFSVAVVDATTLRIEWSTASELNVLGFYLWRSENGDRNQAVSLTEDLIEPQGDLLFGAEYEIIDGSLRPDTQYSYWLQEIDWNGTVSEFGPVTARTPGQPVDEPEEIDEPEVTEPEEVEPEDVDRLYLPFVNR